MIKEDNNLVVLDNLESFSEKLLHLIANVSNDGNATLIGIIQKAQTQYNKPVDSWFTKWVYQFYRVRSEEVSKSIEGLKSQNESLSQIKEFQKLISTGEWNKGSFNHYLFEGLIKALPGYEPLKKELTHDVILRLKEIIAKHIDEYLQKQSQTVQIIPPPPPMLLQPEPDGTGIKLFINPKELERTKGFGFGRDLSSSFIIQGKKGEYSLFWMNSLNKRFTIPMSDHLKLAEWLSTKEEITHQHIKELKSFLKDINTNHSLQVDEFKKELTSCLKGETVVRKKSVQPLPVKKLDMNLFKKVEACISHKYGSKDDVKIIQTKNLPGKIDLNYFKNVAALFEPVNEQMSDSEDCSGPKV